MSDDHKAALAAGREQGRAVKLYLEALAANKPKRGRKRSTESIQKRLVEIEEQLASSDPYKQLQLTQERLDLEEKLGSPDSEFDMPALEKEFVRVAAAYATNKKISHTAFRAVGVPAEVLRRAGVTR